MRFGSGYFLSVFILSRRNLLRRSGYVRHWIPERNPIPNTVLLGGLLDASRVDEAHKLFDEMP